MEEKVEYNKIISMSVANSTDSKKKLVIAIEGSPIPGVFTFRLDSVTEIEALKNGFSKIRDGKTEFICKGRRSFNPTILLSCDDNGSTIFVSINNFKGTLKRKDLDKVIRSLSSGIFNYNNNKNSGGNKNVVNYKHGLRRKTR